MTRPGETEGDVPLPGISDVEGDFIPAQFASVIDAHVHLFPDRVFQAIWRWFDAHAWPVRYKLYSHQVLRFLFSRGVSRVVGLAYSHKPDMARALNSYMSELCRNETRLIGLATVLPGEPNAAQILKEAFASGLRGVKLHCHVQCFAPDSEPMREIYNACIDHGRPVVIHAGREPISSQYACDPYELCSAERIERVLKAFPGLQLCVPHLGADEFEDYQRLLDRYENLWLDTTMALADYLPQRFYWPDLLSSRPDRILYGTDFPNLPYAWDREIRKLTESGLSPSHLAKILSENALKLFSVRSLEPKDAEATSRKAV